MLGWRLQIPPWLGEMVLTAVAKSFSNSTQVDVRTAIPHFMNPALAACQLVNVSKPGKEPKVRPSMACCARGSAVVHALMGCCG